MFGNCSSESKCLYASCAFIGRFCFIFTFFGSVRASFLSYYYSKKKKKLGSLICKLGNTLVSFFLLAYSLCMPNACAWFALVVSTEHSHACQNHSSVAY